MRCVVLDDLEGMAAASTDWSGLEVEFLTEHFTPEELILRLSGVEALVVMRERTPVDRELLEHLPSLRLIVSTGARNSSIDLDACTARGVLVGAAPASSSAAAQLTWALLLAAARGLPDALSTVRGGGWWLSRPGIDLEGRRLGLIGLGRMGSAVARYGTAFDMDVVAWSPNLTAARCRAVGAHFVDLSELMSTSDFVSLHLVSSPRTHGIIGDEQIRLMQSTSWLINTSRGALVDTSALVDALSNHRIAGAAIDVFDAEPLDSLDPLRSLPNVIATPHVGYATDRQLETWYRNVAEQLTGFVAGRPLSTPLN